VKAAAEPRVLAPGWRGPAVALAVLWAAFAWWLAAVWPLNADEGFYLAVSRALGQGLLPYRDYAYTQTPLLPLLQAPLALALPASLASIRLISLLWITGSLALCFALLRGRLGSAALLGVHLVLFLSLPAFGFLSMGKTYALAQLLFLVAALPLFLEWRPLAGLAWLSLFSVLCVGCRLTLAPAVLVLYAGYCLLRCRGRSPLLVLGVPVLFAGAFLGPFIAVDPERFRFFNWGYHQMSTIDRHPAGFLGRVFVFAPGVWLLGLCALPLAMRRLSGPGVLLLASLAGVAANVVIAGSYAEYNAPFVFGTWLGALILFAHAASPRLRTAVVVLALILSAVCVRLPELERPLDSERTASAFLRANTAEGDAVLASMPEIPVCAGRPLYRGLLMGKFVVTADLSPELASGYGFLHASELLSCVAERRPAAVVLSRYRTWNFRYSMPSLRNFGKFRQDWLLALHQGYRIAYLNDAYVVLLRRPPGAPPPSDEPPEH